ncbi:MAG: NB-ARC domain-containing protein [Chloroflexota bacterium]|nr:NB-ARC domain-containing protein [Chloroflexota bacterium]
MAEPAPASRAGAQPAPLVPLRGVSRFAARLPVPLSSFIGREQEAAKIADFLRREEVRLLTLTGPGGVGKTRLALQVAEELEGDFADGVACVSLAALADPGLVGPAVAHALNVGDVGDRSVTDRLITALHDRHLLLLIDNFEQVVAAASLVSIVLAACPRLTILATSRVSLRLSGEQTYPVPPLTLPDLNGAGNADSTDRTEAVRLFVARARAVKPDFALTDANAATVAGICRQLDGLPLAIELAAARVATLPPASLLARLDQRLPLLTRGPQDAPARLRSMREAINWSYDLLGEDEQLLFRRLSVFVGGFTLKAGEAVVSGMVQDVFDGATQLVEKSLLRLEEWPSSEPRFTMLETIREFGLDRLTASGEEPRHAAPTPLTSSSWPSTWNWIGMERDLLPA